MSRLLRLGGDSLNSLLSWLDLRSICYLDIAVGNVDERLLWLHSLQTIDSQAVEEYEHVHASIRWLIIRGARTSRIRVRRFQNGSDIITDETFAGMGNLSVYVVRSKKLAIVQRNVLRRIFCFNLRRREITTTNGPDTIISVGVPGCPHLKHIDIPGPDDMSCSDRVTDIGLSSIVQACPHLESINLCAWQTISDIGISALVQGCPALSMINLTLCSSISDIAVSAIVSFFDKY